MKQRKRTLLLVMASLLVICLFSTTAMAAENFSDMPKEDHWSYEALVAVVDHGILSGYDGKINPQDSLTRGEMASMIVRAYGSETKADISGFTDVPSTAWFHDAMAKAVQMGVIYGKSDTTLAPESNITREEAFAIVARALCLEDGDEASLDKVPDKDEISSWAKGSIAALVSKGYIVGYSDGSIKPGSRISREEFAQIMFSIYKQYLDEKTTVTKVEKGNVIVRTDDITLKNLTVDGDLILAEGINDGAITLDDVTVKGRLVIRGGGENGVKLIKSTVENAIAAKSFPGVLGIDNTQSEQIKTLTIADGIDNVTLKGNYQLVRITPLALSAKNTVKLSLDAESAVDKISVDENCKVKIIIPDNDYKLMVDAENYDNVIVNTKGGDAVTLLGGRPINQVFDVKAEQKKINYTDASLTLNNYRALTSNGVNEIKVTATMNYGGVETRKVEKVFDLYSEGNVDLKKSQWTAEMDFADFGKFNVKVDCLKDKESIYAKKFTTGIVAEEYNLAPLNASFPVTYFTLSLWDICEKQDGTPIPTMMFLERNQAYDWDALPENVYPLPSATKESVTEQNLFRENADLMRQYVKDLYDLNPDSKFNLYCVDNYGEYILKMLVANGIPEDQYTGILLSDGVGTYGVFNRVFNIANPQEKYKEMAANWHELKVDVAKTGKLDVSKVKYKDYDSYQIMLQYAYVMANEEDNIIWWMARPGNFSLPAATDGGTFLNSVKSNPKIITKNLATMLADLQSKGNDVINEFKTLYHFSDSYFSEAVEQNKKVMMILGTKVTSESNFSDYSKFLMEYCGDEFVYYYKGHPGSPTGLYPEKQKELDELGIIDVDSSVAAELILFFYPDIYASGYSTTVFTNLESEEMANGLFGWTKAAAYADANVQSYAAKMKFFISPTSSADTTYGKLCPAGKTCYLVEFNNVEIHDIAIWNATDEVSTYYKIVDGDFVEVVK